MRVDLLCCLYDVLVPHLIDVELAGGAFLGLLTCLALRLGNNLLSLLFAYAVATDVLAHLVVIFELVARWL